MEKFLPNKLHYNKMQIIKAQQSEIFGEIDIIANEEGIDKEIVIDGQLEGNY